MLPNVIVNAVVTKVLVVSGCSEPLELEPVMACKVVVVGETLVSLNVSGSALRGRQVASMVELRYEKPSHSAVVNVWKEVVVSLSGDFLGASSLVATLIRASSPSRDFPEYLRLILFLKVGVW